MTRVGGNTAWLPRCAALPIAFLDLWLESDWAVKVYVIGSIGQASTCDIVAAAQRAFNAGISWVARADKNDPQPNVGFVLLSSGPTPWVLRMRFCWWANDGNTLCTEMLGSVHYGKSARFRPIGRGDILADVNELRVIAFEREVWETMVLSTRASSALQLHLDSYLASHL